jgi:ankyrin repeat protein
MGHPNLDALKNTQGDTLLTRAALHQAGPTALALCKLLIEHGASPRTTMRHGRTTLIEMVQRRGKYHNKVAALLQSSINVQDNDGRTALMFAAEGAGLFGSRRGNLSLARDLIGLHADPLIQDHRGKTALGYALASNDKGTNQDMVHHLKQLMKMTIALREFDKLYRHEFDNNGCLSFSPRKRK